MAKASKTLSLTAVMLVFGAACYTPVPRPPAPAEPSSGEVVAEVSIEATRFVLHDEGAGCVAVEIVHPGLQTTVQRSCFAGEQVLSITDSCGWLVEPPEDRALGVCDVELPTVIYGKVTEPEIAYVCVGTVEEPGGAAGVTSARFVSIGDAGYIFEPALPGESPYGHLFTADGLIYGEPPLDAPSGPIYEFCQSQGPWSDTGLEYFADLLVSVAAELQSDRVTLIFEAGLGEIGVHGGALEEGPMPLSLRIPASSDGLEVKMLIGSEVVFSHEYPWPENMRSLLGSGEPCPGLLIVHAEVGADVIDAESTALELGAQTGACG